MSKYEHIKIGTFTVRNEYRWRVNLWGKPFNLNDHDDNGRFNIPKATPQFEHGQAIDVDSVDYIIGSYSFSNKIRPEYKDLLGTDDKKSKYAHKVIGGSTEENFVKYVTYGLIEKQKLEIKLSKNYRPNIVKLTNKNLKTSIKLDGKTYDL